MKYQGFVGASYVAQAKVAAADECINYYPERLEVANPKSDLILIGTPGLAIFATLPTQPVQGVFATPDLMFALAGGVLYQIFADGTFRVRVAAGKFPAAGPASMTWNTIQLFISCGGNLLVYDTTTFALTGVGLAGGITPGFMDSYVIAAIAGTRSFQISGLLDPNFDPLDVGVKEGGADNLVATFVDHREVWLLGEESSEVLWNSGNPNFPFERIQGSFIECGCAAALSPAKFDNSLGWLGRDARGNAVVYRANGYTPQRISTHALEFAMSKYPRIDDAIGSSHQYRGHTFYRLDFPSAKPAAPAGIPAGETWFYDSATRLWHQRAFWNVKLARFEAHRGRFQCFAFDKHLVGDYTNGNIYEMSADYLDDFGQPLRSVRTAPHQYQEGNWIYYHWYRFDMQVGDGLPGNLPATAILQLSNDGGRTWGNEMSASLGPVGAYKQRVQFNRGSRARDRVARLIMSDPVPRVLVAAYFDATVGRS